MMTKERSELNDLIDSICLGRFEEYLQNLSQTTVDENIKIKINSVLQEIKYFRNNVIIYSECISQAELNTIINSIKDKKGR